MRGAILTVAAALLAWPAAAQEGPSLGCYLRDYSDAHLARHPAQIVDTIKMSIRRDDYGHVVAALRVRLANQGHVVQTGHAGRVMDQFLICWQDGARAMCGVECDGGTMEFTRDDAAGVVFRTRFLAIGQVDGCGGVTDLAESPGEFVSYRLDRVAPAACEGM